MGTAGKSIDEIAELRARRILLNERPPADVTRWGQIDSTLEMLVAGLDSSQQLTESPIPAVYLQFQDNIPFFLAAARLDDAVGRRGQHARRVHPFQSGATGQAHDPLAHPCLACGPLPEPGLETGRDAALPLRALEKPGGDELR